MSSDVELRDKRIYIAHPYNGLTGSPEEMAENMEHNAAVCRAVMKAFPGITPVSPLCAFSFYSGEDQADILRCCFRLIEACDAVWVFGDWEKSEGTAREIVYALKNNKRVCLCSLFSPYAGVKISETLVRMEDFAILAASRLRSILSRIGDEPEGCRCEKCEEGDQE